MSLRGAKRRSNSEEFARYYHALRDRDDNKASNALRLHMEEKNQKEKIAAVVVTYNRKDLLKECLDALFNQTRPLDSIILIDNASTDGTLEFLKEKGYLDNPKLDYVRLPENTGGSGGFHEGVKKGYEKGYDWLWLMDDDSEPKKDALEKLSKYFSKRNLSALAGSVLLPNDLVCYGHRGYIDFNKIWPLLQKPSQLKDYKNQYTEIDMASFVGILISREAIRKIGYPKKEFFIYHDDVEYCIRLRKVGRILLIPDSVIVHKEASRKNPSVKKIFFGRKSKRSPYDKLWFSYYGRRNLIWLGKKYSTNKFNFYFGLLKNILKSLVGILIYDDNKFRRIKFEINVYLDGLRGNFNNEKPKRILYKK